MPDIAHELSITRSFPVPRPVIWRCWTEPALLSQWFCPRPWRVAKADFDLRPGGRMDITMRGPSGEEHVMPGIWLDVVPMERLTFTDAFSEGFMPRGTPFMTGFVRLEDVRGGTRMIWGARHWSAEDKARHEAMGFHEGWAAAANQLDELAMLVADAEPAARSA